MRYLAMLREPTDKVLFIEHTMAEIRDKVENFIKHDDVRARIEVYLLVSHYEFSEEAGTWTYD